MRVLVTGGAGFIGSHLIDALLDRGAEVSMADHLHRSPKPWFGEALLRGAQLYVADVRDLNAIRPALKPSALQGRGCRSGGGPSWPNRAPRTPRRSPRTRCRC